MKDNIPFTMGETVGLFVGGILLGGCSAFYISVLVQHFYGEILTALCSSVVLVIALGFVAVFPKLLNRSDTPEEEIKDCRTIRRGCVIGGIIAVCGIFLAMLMAMGYVEMFFEDIIRAVQELF